MSKAEEKIVDLIREEIVRLDILCEGGITESEFDRIANGVVGMVNALNGISKRYYTSYHNGRVELGYLTKTYDWVSLM